VVFPLEVAEFENLFITQEVVTAFLRSSGIQDVDAVWIEIRKEVLAFAKRETVVEKQRTDFKQFRTKAGIRPCRVVFLVSLGKRYEEKEAPINYFQVNGDDDKAYLQVLERFNPDPKDEFIAQVVRVLRTINTRFKGWEPRDYMDQVKGFLEMEDTNLIKAFQCYLPQELKHLFKL
jgi:hypothetical protein